jgi:hypothetical protein
MHGPRSIAIGAALAFACAGAAMALEPSLSTLRSGCRFKSRHNPFPELWLACGGGHSHPVVGRASLRGHVEIRNAKQALEFARLFTVPGTWLYGVPEEIVEVVPGAKADRFGFIVPRFDFAQCCVSPTVLRGGGSKEKPWFEVRRTVVHRPDYAVYLLTEAVSHDGTIVRKEMRMLDVDGRSLGTFITPPTP